MTEKQLIKPPKGAKIPKGYQIDTPRIQNVLAWGYHVWDTHYGNDKQLKDSVPVSNNRGDFLRYIVRDAKELDDNQRKNIGLSLDAYKRHLISKKQAGDKLIGVRTLSVWYNKGLYEEQFIDESAASIHERSEAKLCSCGKSVHGEKFDLCTDCLHREKADTWRNHRIQALKDLGLLNEKSTYQDVIQNCKERGSVNGTFSLARMFALSQTSLIKPLEYNKQKT